MDYGVVCRLADFDVNVILFDIIVNIINAVSHSNRQEYYQQSS